MFRVKIKWVSVDGTKMTEERVIGFCEYEPTKNFAFVLSVPSADRVFEINFGIVQEFRSYGDYHDFLTINGVFTYELLEVIHGPKTPLNVVPFRKIGKDTITLKKVESPAKRVLRRFDLETR